MERAHGHTSESRIRRRDAILAAVSRSAELLAEARPWQLLVPEVLALLGEATRVSRVYVFEIERPDGIDRVSQRFEWCGPGIAPQIDNPGLQNVPLEEAGYARWGELMRAAQPIFGDVSDFPESERPLLQLQEIRSILVQPIFDGKRLWGFMGFDACEAEQSWERVEVDTLRIAVLLLGSTMHRQTRDQQMREVQKLEALGRMASSVAHDFNNVLMVIAGGMELLKGQMEAAGNGALAHGRQAAMIDQALDRASSLTRRLLEFSRRQSGVAQEISPIELLRREEPLLRQAIGPRIRLRILQSDGSARVEPVRIDPTEFAQILLNLAVNARDAMPEGGELRFEVSTLHSSEPPASEDQLPEGTWTLMRVIDSGEGMPPEVLAQAFEPFFTTKARDKGTGLGLPTVQGIVSGARGHIRVTSVVRRGTEFRVYLPIAPARDSSATSH